MKKVCLVLLNWNGWQMTKGCLLSLSKIIRTGIDLEVVIVDNGSTDESKEQIQNTKIKYQNRGFKLIAIFNDKNLGFAEGNNVAIRYAIKWGADYVCLLNNDTRVDKNFLWELVRCAENNLQAGAIGGKIYFEKGLEFHKERYQKAELGKVLWYAGGLIDWQNVYGSNRGVDEVDRGQYDQEIDTDYVNGCLTLLKTEAIKKVGLLDPRYFLYYEDTDLSLRLQRAGFRLVYCPRAVIWHLNSGSSASGSDLHDYFITRNRLLFGLRWAPLRSKAALLRESLKLLFFGRSWQRVGVRDYYLRRLGKGSWR